MGKDGSGGELGDAGRGDAGETDTGVDAGDVLGLRGAEHRGHATLKGVPGHHVGQLSGQATTPVRETEKCATRNAGEDATRCWTNSGSPSSLLAVRFSVCV